MKLLELSETKNNLPDILEFTAPGSKSVTNRMLIISALCENQNILKNVLFSEDTLVMINALSDLGIKFKYNIAKKELWKLTPQKLKTKHDIYIGLAGTVYRFLPVYLLSKPGNYKLYGEPELFDRPVEDLFFSLNKVTDGLFYINKEENYMSVEINSVKDFDKIILNPKKSSQFLTALLLNAPVFNKNFEILCTEETVSKTYIDLTLDLMKQTGVEVVNKDYKNFGIKPMNYNFESFNIEGDYSSASYYFTAGILLNKKVRVNNLNKNSTQGDKNLLDIFEQMGCKTKYSDNGVLLIPPDKLQSPGNVDMSKMQDIVPTLAVLCAFIKNQKTEISNIENLKYKECDRFNAVINELRKIGVPVEYTDNSIIITGIEKGNAAEIETYKDHRMAMAFTLAGIKIPGLKIKNPECVCKTFPEFYKNFLEIFNIKNNYKEFYSEIYNKQLEKFNIYCTL